MKTSVSTHNINVCSVYLRNCMRYYNGNEFTVLDNHG
jgi:hypothetical protein